MNIAGFLRAAFYRTPTVSNRKFCYHCLAFVFKTSFYFYKNVRLLSIVFISIWYSYSCELSVLYNFSVILTGLWNLEKLLYSQIWQKKLQTFLKWQPEAWVQCRFKSHFSGNLKNSPASFPSYFIRNPFITKKYSFSKLKKIFTTSFYFCSICLHDNAKNVLFTL